MSRKILTLATGVILLVVLLVAMTGATYAANTGPTEDTGSSPSLNFPALQRHCAVLNVYLNGTPHPGISCAHRQLPVKQIGVKHDTTSGSCNGRESMYIAYNHGSNTICFYGTGYLGGFGTLIYVTEVDVFVSVGWFNEYNQTGGHFCTLALDAKLLITESVTITQVDPGASNTGICG